MECKINRIPNFLRRDDCNRIIDWVTRFHDWPVNDIAFWDNRIMTSNYIRNNLDPGTADLIDLIAMRTARFIEEAYGHQRIYPDTVDVVRWFPEMKQNIHCDDMTISGVHGFYHRLYGAILYLNDDYEGGETYYPQWDINVKPEAGMLVIHPGDGPHRHGVTRVKNKTRYTVASFWTVDKHRNVCKAFNLTQV